MISNNLKRQVAREANLLKRYATKEEINRLNILNLQPFSAYQCIYGQMTGYCFGDRATELVKKCAVPVGSRISREIGVTLLPTYRWVKRLWQTIGLRSPMSEKFTAIEVYITQDGAKNKNLINYLKGRTEVLDI